MKTTSRLAAISLPLFLVLRGIDQLRVTDPQLHLSGWTLVLLHDWTVVVLTRHSRLLFCNLSIPAALLQFVSIAYFVWWSGRQIVRLIRAYLARPRIEPRGFPLDPPDGDDRSDD